MTRKCRLTGAAVSLLLLLAAGFMACDTAGRAAGTPEDASAASPETSAPAKAAEPRDPNRLWCSEHGVYEDECVLCHPELANAKTGNPDAEEAPRDPNRLWCAEHSVYEDECVLCHPELKQKLQSEDGQAAHSGTDGATATASGLMCREHGVLEGECGICHPELLTALPAGKGLKVRLPSGGSASKAGVTTAVPVASPADGPQEFTGQISFNQNSLASVTPLVGGVVAEVRKDVGDTVQAGDVLARVKSAEVAQAKSEYLKAMAEAKLARQAYEREKALHERRISARRDMEEAQAAAAVAQAAVDEARQRLLNLGLTDPEAGGAAAAEAEASLLPVRSPLSGTVIERTTVQGTVVEPGQELFQVADLSSMWMQLAIPESSLSDVAAGSPVRARFGAYPGLSFEGEIQWIAPRVNPQTRMVEARAVFPNPQGLLKDGLFGHASLDGAAAGPALTVPSAAIQEVDGMSVVFRKLDDDLYETRRVELGAARDGQVVVLAGLAPGEELVAEGSYVMKSELLKARLGAGCTDH